MALPSIPKPEGNPYATDVDMPPPELGTITPPGAPPEMAPPAAPKSSLADVPAGQAIPPDEAARAEASPGKEQYHSELRNYGDRRNQIRMAKSNLNWDDPNFANKLLGLQAAEGAVNQDEAQFKEKHPWGSPESAHPGILGKIGHAFGAIGNVAGEALAPGLAAAVPGSHLNLEAQKAAGASEESQAIKEMGTAAETQKTLAEVPKVGAEAAQVQAETKKTGAETEKLGDTQLQQQYANAVEDAINRGVDPSTDPHVQQIGDSIQNVQKEPKSGAPKPAHITYDQGIPVSVTKDDKVWDVNDPKMPEEFRSLVTAAKAAHGQSVSEDAAKQARAFNQQQSMFDQRQNALTNATKTMVEAAPKVQDFIKRINQMVKDQQTQLGPAAGRWNEFWTGKVGAPNKDFAKLRTDTMLLQTLLMRMHVGARGGEYIMKHFQDIIDQGKQSPENMLAATEEIGQYANDLRQMGADKGVTFAEHGGGGKGPAVGTVESGHRFKGGDPSKAENWEKVK